MLSLYGLKREAGRVVKGENWAERRRNWFTQDTHNNLRITRLPKSLSTLGLRHEAQALLACLNELRESESNCGVGFASASMGEAGESVFQEHGVSY
jgi:hypothetical protein